MEETIKQLYDRFPLLSRLTVTQTDKSSHAEDLPPFFGFFMAVMDVPPEQPLCFVLPRRGDVGRLAVVLHALHQFVKKQQQLTYNYGLANFNIGDSVLINPTGHVYRYDGFMEDDQGKIWLGELGSASRRSVNASDYVMRLEKTTRKRPKGKLDSKIFEIEPPPLDVLLGTSTHGNRSLIQNEAVLLDSQNGFAGFVDSIAFQRASLEPDMPPLKTLLPFGELSEPYSVKQSWLKKWDERNPAGEPLVAITHSAELLANYCIDAPAKSKLVVINGLSPLKNRQYYDDAAESQRLILFASRDEEEMIETLGRAPIPCKFWWLSAGEINVGSGPAGVNTSTGLVNKITRWANNHERMTIEAVSCENQVLESVCLRLVELGKHFSEDENDPLRKLTSQGWRMLNDTSAFVRPLKAHERLTFESQISRLRTETRNNVWLKPECVNIFNEIASRIESCLLVGGNLGLSKGSALYQVVRESQTAQHKSALIAQNENQISELNLWLRHHNILLDVYTPRTLPDDSSFDRLIFVSWPGGKWPGEKLLKQVADALVSPRITVLAYPFEERWLKQFERRLKKSPTLQVVGSREKGELTDISEAHFISLMQIPDPVAATNTEIKQDFDVWAFEQKLCSARKGGPARPAEEIDTVLARYVSFFGDFYVYLTESHKVPVATGLLSNHNRANQKLPERTCSDILLGDFVVFPESGEREFIQAVADRLIGATSLSDRKIARKWQDTLQTSGLTPEQFYERANDLDYSRHILTIRNWFRDNSQIGPREKDDLTLIALVTGDKKFEAEIDIVWLAIERLWNAHRIAGKHLRDTLLQRLPQVIGQVEENGTKIELGELGSAWIVKVDSVASADELRGRNEVNRLLRENLTSSILSGLDI